MFNAQKLKTLWTSIFYLKKIELYELQNYNRQCEQKSSFLKLAQLTLQLDNSIRVRN